MSTERTYRLVELRKDSTRVVIGTGLSEETAARIRQMLSTEQTTT
jgi:hypothetical protein